MISLVLLLVCATCPWALCFALRAFTLEGAPSYAETSDRALARFRRATLYSAVVALPAFAKLGMGDLEVGQIIEFLNQSRDKLRSVEKSATYRGSKGAPRKPG